MDPAQLLRIYLRAIDQMAAQKSLVLEQSYIDSSIRAEGLTPPEVAPRARELLQTSADTLTGDEIEALLVLAGNLDEIEDGVTIYNDLLLLANHHSHEDVASSLQYYADPSSIPRLIARIEADLPYLAWDEGKALARKCFWALGDINTDAAWHAIEKFSTSDDPVIVQWANEQLTRRRG